MPYDLDAIKRIPIRDVATRLGIVIDSHGKAQCFNSSGHKQGDRHPSMTFRDNRNTFKCWTCYDIRGSVIDLVRLHQSLDTKEAIKWLGDNYAIPDTYGNHGTPISTRPRPVQPVTLTPDVRKDTTKYHALYRELDSHCDASDPRMADYLWSRGIDPKMARRLGVTYLPNQNRAFTALVKKFGMDEVVEAGLAIRRDNWTKFIYQSHPLLFRFAKADKQGRLRTVFYQARTLETDCPSQWRYRTLSGGIPFPWGQWLLRKVQVDSEIYLCEGIMDALSMMQLRKRPALAILGTNNWRPEFAAALAPYKVNICYQNDEPGVKFATGVHDNLSEHNVRVRMSPTPEGFGDINDYLKNKVGLTPGK